jgi:hypothetical protein
VESHRNSRPIDPHERFFGGSELESRQDCCTGRARRDNGRQGPETTAQHQSP